MAGIWHASLKKTVTMKLVQKNTSLKNQVQKQTRFSTLIKISKI